ncbi:hypothetical protein BFP97_01925 [Roseivirga sp. 4D4]|uniref:hypothetical protein n=1 Tax=Roseivirga sp. 4D4 TaxID=1889784 RepID=UPI000852ACFE|nr:hypothetical protein [Roseivirga sp. 4D4]OEK00344.1 hypothetical protein BFP97_01925 [Roseivirga sp. 4D4]
MTISEQEFLEVKADIELNRFAAQNYAITQSKLGYIRYRLLRPILKFRFTRFLRKHKYVPWICPDAVQALRGLLNDKMTGFEYGSGKSTIFYSKLLKTIHSIEHNEPWFNKVNEMISDLKITNAKLDLVLPNKPVDQQHMSSKAQLSLTREEYPVKDEVFNKYVRAINSYDDSSIDFVSIDGRARVSCTEMAVPKLKSGGILLLDNSERLRYKKVHETLKSWPSMNTTTGLTDTTIWRKP